MRIVANRLGMVHLVGAGPGDPGLITVRGLRALKAADVVVYDRLVHPDLLAEIPLAVERICVGKKGGHYSFPQTDINRLLVDRARKGQSVVRLKGGDPYVFGRGGEEALHLLESGVPFEVVPGVSSALAVPEAAGIPVTFRGISSSVTIVSGHQADDPENPLNWQALAAGSETIVVLMPLNNLRSIVSSLVLNGRSITTPAAVIEKGSCADQRTVASTLGEIASEAQRIGLASPAILVVGEVVRLRERLADGLQREANFSEPQERPSALP